MELLYEPWPWYVAGPLIAGTMFLLIYFGKNFGISANLRTICAVGGGHKCSDFFNFNWRSQIWNLIFVFGAVIGGFLAANFMTPDQAVNIAPATVSELEKLGFENVGDNYLPSKIFSAEALKSFSGFIILLLGGFLVGFGSRYAGGCTSGHAISGLSDLQLSSLIAVVGFFIGGLSMVYFFMPMIF